jgi:hypothetical protein
MSFLLIHVALAASLAASAFAQSPLDDPEFPYGSQKVDGAWRRDVPGQFSAVKHFFDGRYVVFQYKPESNFIIWSAFGVFHQEGSTLKEKVKSTSNGDLLNRKFSWSLGFAGDGVYSQSSGGSKEVWSRLSNESNNSTLEGVSDYSSNKTDLDGVWYQPWGKENTYIKMFDKGRAYCLGFTNDKKTILFLWAGIFSVDSQGVLREKYIYVTANNSSYKNTLLLFKATLSADKRSFVQKHPSGARETWTRWGNLRRTPKFGPGAKL